MLSTKRLLYVILIVLVVSAIFMVYNINEERSKTVKMAHAPAAQEEFTADAKLSESNQLKVYVVGNEKKKIYRDIYKNTIQILKDLHIPYSNGEKLEPEELDRESLIIFCDDTINTHTDLIQLGKFISEGGKVIFAGGLSEGTEDSYLWPFLGITEKSVKENYNKLEFVNQLLPLQFNETVYDGYNASTWIAVREDAEKYIQDAEKEVPVLHTYDYGKGQSCLINGTFLADMGCCGMLTGAMGTVLEDFIYPVMGTKVVFLDNFPMVTYVNDKVCMKMYGCSTESFVRDVIWTQFQGMSLRTDTVYSSSILTEASEEKSFPEINDSLFTTIGKSALQYDGELIFAVNCTNPKKIYYNNNFINQFNDVFEEYDITGLALISEELNDEMLQIPETKIKSVRGHLDAEVRMKYDEDYFVFPAASYGNNMEDGNLFELSSILGAYGMVSHVFDINMMITEDESTPSWDLDKKQIGLFESKILRDTSYLEGRTLSDTKDIVKSYMGLNYQWKKEKNKMYLNCSGIRKGQTFFYKTDSKIVDATGLTFEEAGNGYYLLQVNENNAVIELEER